MFPKALFLLALSFLLPLKAAAQIYADVQVGGAVNGTFTITLEHTKTPGTVANFIGLATGQRGWLDLTTGAIRYTPFYDGIIFHRVMAGFMNQTGSKAGNGTDDAGYKFRDEFDATLRHDAPYVVSMANSGKHTNGSQFFITVAPTSWLNDVHTIFGRVTAGSAIIDQINATPTTGVSGSPPDRPLTPISIQSVSIHGPSLAAFNLDPAWLPKVLNGRPVLSKTGATFNLEYDHLPYSDYSVFESGSLAPWTKPLAGYFGAIPSVGPINVTSIATGTQHFFRLSRVDYSTCATADVAGNTFQFPSLLGGGMAALNAAKTSGMWTYTAGGTSAIVSASLTPQPYTARFYVRLGNASEALLNLQYNTAGAGTYSGQTYTPATGVLNVSGTFTVAP